MVPKCLLTGDQYQSFPPPLRQARFGDSEPSTALFPSYSSDKTRSQSQALPATSLLHSHSRIISFARQMEIGWSNAHAPQRVVRRSKRNLIYGSKSNWIGFKKARDCSD